MPTYPQGRKFITKFMVGGVRYTRMTDSADVGAAWELAARAALKLGKPLPEPDAPKKDTRGGGGASVSVVLRATRTRHWEPMGPGADKQILNAETFVRWCGPLMSASEAFSQANVDKFFEYLRTERRVSNSTINKYRSAISVMLGYSGLSEDSYPELPWYKILESRVRVFTPEEWQIIPRQWRLWRFDREADFFVFLLKTGARPYIDGARLNWSNVFPPNNPQSKASVHFIAAKNGNARTVPLTPEAWAAVQRQDRSASGPWAWANKEHMRPIWTRTISAFPQLADAVLYTARHTFGTELYRRSRDIKMVKDLMGHKNYKTTEVYVHMVGNDSYAYAADLLADPAPQSAPTLAVVSGDG